MNKVCIIFDCSGSMAEMGCRAVIKNLLMAVRQRYPRVEMYRWNDAIQQITKAKEITTAGRASTKAWIDFLSNASQDTNILLVSDGCWSTQDTNDICSAIQGRSVCACFLGQGANLATLSKVQTMGRKVFRIADFPTVIEHLLRT